MSEEELDMVNPGGCSDNPLVELLKKLKSGATRVRVKARRSTLPLPLAGILADKYGYMFKVEFRDEEVYEATFTKK